MACWLNGWRVRAGGIEKRAVGVEKRAVGFCLGARVMRYSPDAASYSS